jgi:uncharacterized membrane protein
MLRLVSASVIIFSIICVIIDFVILVVLALTGHFFLAVGVLVLLAVAGIIRMKTEGK